MYVPKLCLLTFCYTASSFTPTTKHSPTTTFTRRVIHRQRQLKLSDRGWDNGNFLDALGGGQKSIEEANEKYRQESEARAAIRERQFRAMAHDVRFEQIPDDEVPQQQQSMQFQAPPPPPPSYMPQQPQAPAMGQQAQPTMDPQAYYQALQAWQQAMVAFSQFSAANPQAAAQMTPPPPPPPPPVFNPYPTSEPQGSVQQQYQAPPPPQQSSQQQQQQQQPQQQYQESPKEEPKSVYDYLPKRAGGNNDAYEVNNSADVYFAQLKRDSTIRTEARKRGDLETANSPFTEKGVIALGGLLSEELIASRRAQLARNGGEFETSRDEMLLPQHFAGEEDTSESRYTGVSYKDRLMQAKQKKTGQQ